MKKAIANLLRRLADWLDPAPLPLDPGPLDARAAFLVTKAEQLAGSGEYRRHQVYARLIKEFPGVRKLELSKAIDRAVERLG